LLLQRRQVCRATGHGSSQAAQREVELHRLGALGRRQVGVARAQGQPVGGALGRAGVQGQRQGQLLRHLTQHQPLLVVLLPKNGVATALALPEHERKQLEHHGAHAGKKTGPKLALEDVGQLGRRQQLEALRLRIQLRFRRGKQHIATGGFELRAVGLEGARVAVEIFVRQKLQAVDEDAGHRHVAQWPGAVHQSQMAGVQVAHGGHEGGAVKLRQVLAQFGAAADDAHGVAGAKVGKGVGGLGVAACVAAEACGHGPGANCRGRQTGAAPPLLTKRAGPDRGNCRL